jgi:fatty acid desaturase
MGWLFGSSIAGYRRVHLQHHRALGTTEDSENSYFDALRVRYLVSSLAGLRVLRVLRHRREVERRSEPAGGSRVLWLTVTAAVNLALAAGLWLLGAEVAAVAWLLGLLVAFPFFVSLRQLLEHRSEDAQAAVDYRVVDHGAVNRLFGDGPVASTLGSAGFNRHALHHWEPTLSYTRLADVEEYLLRTPIAPAVRARQTTYRDTFLRLLEP